VGAVDKPSAAWGKKRHKRDKKEPPRGTIPAEGERSENPLTPRTGHAAFRVAYCIYKRPQACFGLALIGFFFNQEHCTCSVGQGSP